MIKIGHKFTAEHNGKPLPLWITHVDDWGLCTCENGEVYVFLYDLEITRIENSTDKIIHTALTEGKAYWDEWKGQ